MWDGEIAGMTGGLAKVRREKKVLILADSKAAIAAMKKAGRTGRARSRHLQRTVNMVAEIGEGGGEVKLGGVKAHIGTLGNEAAESELRREYPQTVMISGCRERVLDSGRSGGRGRT